MTTLTRLNSDMGDILLTNLNTPAQDCSITMPVVSGKSAYDLAVENGYVGNLDAWLASIKGWQPISSAEYMELLNNTLKDSLLYTDLTSKIDVMGIKFHDDLVDTLSVIQANKSELIGKHNELVENIKLTQKQILDETKQRITDSLSIKESFKAESEQRVLDMEEALEAIKSEEVTRVKELTKIDSTYTQLLETYTDGTKTRSRRLEAYESDFKDLSGKVVTSDIFNQVLTSASSTEAITNVISKYKTEFIDPVLDTKVSTETIKDYYNKSDAKKAINTALEEYQAEIIDPALNEKASASVVTQIESKVNNSTTGLEATARKLEGVFLQVNPVYLGTTKGSIGSTQSQLGVWSESSARMEADFAIAQRMDVLNIKLDDSTASIQTLNKVVIDKTQSLAERTDSLETEFDGKNPASAISKLGAVSTATDSATNFLRLLNSKFDQVKDISSEAGILDNYYTTTKADGAIAGQIKDFQVNYVDEKLGEKASAQAFANLSVEIKNTGDALKLTGEKLDGFILKKTAKFIGTTTGSIGDSRQSDSLGAWNEYSAIMEKDYATAKRIDNLSIELKDSKAAINTVNQIITDTTQSLAKRTEVIEAEFNKSNPSSIKSVTEALSNATESSTKFLKLLNSKFETATGNTTEVSVLDGFYNTAQTDKVITQKITELKADYIDKGLELKASAKAFSNLEAAVNDTDKGLVATANKLDGVYLQVNPLLLGSTKGSIGDTTAQKGIGAWSEYSARLEDNFAIATKLDTVTTALNGNTATIKTQQESLNGLSAKWSVKMDINGRAVGFGLAADSSGDKPRSEFAVVADKFYIASPNDTGKGKLLFQVLNAPVTIDNITVPAGVYMDGAFIRYASIDTAHIRDGAIQSAKIFDAAITSAKIADGNITTAKIGDLQVSNAKIANLAVTDAKIANLDAAKITTGYLDAARIKAESITADKIDTKGLSIKDDNGKVILGAGTGLDVNSINGIGNFAKVNKLTYSNISMYVDGLGVKNLLVGDAQIGNANIANAQIDTLKIANQAVSISSAINQPYFFDAKTSAFTDAIYLDAGGTQVSVEFSLISCNPEGSGSFSVECYVNGVSKNTWNMAGTFGYYPSMLFPFIVNSYVSGTTIIQIKVTSNGAKIGAAGYFLKATALKR